MGRTLLSLTARWIDENCVCLPLDPGGRRFAGRALADKACPELEGSVRPTSPRSRSKTMCLPMRRTAAMRLCSRVAAMSDAGDFSGSFFWPSQTESTTSPVTRLARPRAMVSTSGSSGMGAIGSCRVGGQPSLSRGHWMRWGSPGTHRRLRAVLGSWSGRVVPCRAQMK